MSVVTRDEAKASAILIKNEVATNANTAVRVGSLLEDVADSVLFSLNVRGFGAIGDGVADDTTPIQNAIDAAHMSGGNLLSGEVWLPPTTGGYRVTAPLTLRRYVTLRGSARAPGRGKKVLDVASFAGSTLKIDHVGVGVNFEADACVDGIGITYPNQVTTGTPVVHDFTFKMDVTHGCTIRNVWCPNPYRFIYAKLDGGIFENIIAWPLETGLHLSRCADVVRVKGCHFNPNCFPSVDQTLRDWVLANATAYKVDGAEGFQWSHVHAFGYNIGLHMADGGLIPGSTGHIENGAFDQCNTGVFIADNGVSNDGIRLSQFVIVPKVEGIKIDDSTQGPGEDNLVEVELANVSIFNGGGYTRGIWVTSASNARVLWSGGSCRDFSGEMVLNQSANSKGRLSNIRCPVGTRVSNTGGGDWAEVNGMA